MYPSRAIGWSDTFLVTKPGGEPLSRIASRESMHQASESCWQRCCRDDVGRGMMSLLSHAGDGAAEVTWL